MVIQKNDSVWMSAPAINEIENRIRFLGVFATPYLVESVIDDTHVSISPHGGPQTLGKDVFLTREECIEKKGPDQWAEELEPHGMHVDGANMTPFASEIPDDAYPGGLLMYYLGYPYQYGESIPWSVGTDGLPNFREILDYIRNNKPQGCPLKITLASSDAMGGGSIYSFGFIDDEHWYMHGVTSSLWA